MTTPHSETYRKIYPDADLETNIFFGYSKSYQKQSDPFSTPKRAIIIIEYMNRTDPYTKMAVKLSYIYKLMVSK